MPKRLAHSSMSGYGMRQQLQPGDKVEGRIPRLLSYIRDVLPLCDHVRVLDNSRADDPFRQVAIIRVGRVERLLDPVPEWAEWLLLHGL
jgi:predicted ABC-type ATPase